MIIVQLSFSISSLIVFFSSKISESKNFSLIFFHYSIASNFLVAYFGNFSKCYIELKLFRQEIFVTFRRISPWIFQFFRRTRFFLFFYNTIVLNRQFWSRQKRKRDIKTEIKLKLSKDIKQLLSFLDDLSNDYGILWLLRGCFTLLLLLSEFPERSECFPLTSVVIESDECVDEHRNNCIIRLLNLFLFEGQ